MSTLRRAIIATAAATACVGTGLTFAAEASAAPPPSSWGCRTTAAAIEGGTLYSAQCSAIPSGRKMQLVVNCKLFPSGKTNYTGPWVDTNRPSSVRGSLCTSHDGTVTTYGPRAG